MNLAETASIFFETVVGDRLIEMASTPEEKLRCAKKNPTSPIKEPYICLNRDLMMLLRRQVCQKSRISPTAEPFFFGF
jgi:hypothetical protein